MSQNDLTIANQGFASFRSDLNSALQALGSTNSGTSAPSTTFANQLFYDTTNNILKIRNEDNDAFISLFTLDQTNDNIEALTISGTLTYTGDLVSSTAGTSNFRAGVNAGNSITSGGNYNVTVGDEAGTAITTGDNIVAVGYGAGDALTLGSSNTAVGMDSLTNEVAGHNNTAIGKGALQAQTTASSGVVNNTAVGRDAGLSITSGVQNTIVGSLAGDALTDADGNVAVGYGALTSDTKGNKSTAIGLEVLGVQNFTSSTDTHNTAIGFQAGASVTTGTNNTIIGSGAGDGLNTGSTNTIVGVSALGNATTADLSTVMGYQAGFSITTGDRNTLYGVNAGYSLTEGASNTFIGGASTGAGNGAGKAMTTGSKNTILGTYDGNQHSLDIRTSSNNVVLSDGDGYPNLFITSGGHAKFNTQYPQGVDLGNSIHQFVNTFNNNLVTDFKHMGGSSAFGIRVTFSDITHDNNSNYFLYCQDSTASRLFIYSDGDVQNHDNSYTGLSDERVKEQITNASSQWEDIKALQVRKFKFKTDVSTKGDSDDLWRLGVIAQEVEEAGMNGLVKNNPDLIENENGEIVEGDTTTKAVKYSILYMKAVKALQEAMTRIETLEAKVATLEGA